MGKNADARVAAELCLMQLCEPSLKLDAQSLGARVSKLEERLATGNFTPAKQQAKAESAENEEDDDRPPFPDDADDPLAGLAPPMDAREAEKPQKIAAEKASAFFGRPMQVQFALAGQLDASGKDPMDALLALGKEHSDIMTIK